MGARTCSCRKCCAQRGEQQEQQQGALLTPFFSAFLGLEDLAFLATSFFCAGVGRGVWRQQRRGEGGRKVSWQRQLGGSRCSSLKARPIESSAEGAQRCSQAAVGALTASWRAATISSRDLSIFFVEAEMTSSLLAT